MNTIRVLDEETVNQIAAGEVIERPAAVVKELLENAVDAGAGSITVEIKEGGVTLIRVTDNGRGIQADEVKTAFQRHATSKLRKIGDLLQISSLGFRGEALSSIAAAAQVEIITKTAGELTGSRYTIDNGKAGELEPVGCPEGTTFLVRELFGRLPARRKFLKSAQTESSYIHDILEHLAISHPEISLKYIQSGQVKLQTSGNGSQKDTVYQIYGRETAANLIEMNKANAWLRIDGYICKPVVSRGNRNDQNYFINGRYIRNALINRAIEDAYQPYIMQHRYPFTVINLTMSGEWVDVNVHPSKLEVRFSNAQEVYQLVYEAVSEALHKKELIPGVRLTEEKTEKHAGSPVNSGQKGSGAALPEPFETRRRAETDRKLQEELKKACEIMYDTANARKSDEGVSVFAPEKPQCPDLSAAAAQAVQPLELKDPNGENDPNGPKPDKTTKEPYMTDPVKAQEQLCIPEEMLLSEHSRKQHRIIGQLFSTYWLVEWKDDLFLIDQHAAHEKVLYERTMARIHNQETQSQQLLPPAVVSLSPREEAALPGLLPYLRQLGFETEHFGGREYAVTAVPAGLFRISAGDYFTEVLDGYLENETPGAPEVLLEQVASLSCKAAVKGNMTLSTAEAEALIDELMTLENPYHCPHGRPTIIRMSKYEIEKKFKRIV